MKVIDRTLTLLCYFLYACALLIPQIFIKEATPKVDVLIFSYNRPMQLYACLESIQKHFSNFNSISVVYREDEKYAPGYEVVKQSFNTVTYYKQQENPKTDFKPLTLKAVFEPSSSARHVMFAVDDIIVVDDLDLSLCARLLDERKDVWQCALRLGLNLDYCYMAGNKVKAPIGTYITVANEQFYIWGLNKWHGDWTLGSSVDMSVLRKKDIKPYLDKLAFDSPGALEQRWWTLYGYEIRPKNACCFLHSKIINIPMNIVQDFFKNEKHAHGYTVDELQDMFMKGLKIDISKFYKIENNSCHYPAPLAFIPRETLCK